jgi:hypothetical protein
MGAVHGNLVSSHVGAGTPLEKPRLSKCRCCSICMCALWNVNVWSTADLCSLSLVRDAQGATDYVKSAAFPLSRKPGALRRCIPGGRPGVKVPGPDGRSADDDLARSAEPQVTPWPYWPVDVPSVRGSFLVEGLRLIVAPGVGVDVDGMALLAEGVDKGADACGSLRGK